MMHIDPNFYVQAPPAENREEREMAVYHFLDEHGIPYRRLDHEAADTMEKCEEVEKVLGAPICKNLFLCNRQQTKFYLLCMPGDKPFKTKELSAQIGSARLSFAGEEHMLKYLNIKPGSVSVLGLMNDASHQVNLLIDEDLKGAEDFACHPCVCTSTLLIRTEDLLNHFLTATGHIPQYVHLTGEV